MDPDTIHRRRWAILGVLALSVFLVVVDNTIVNVALPTLSRELDAGISELQWIVDAYALVFAGLLLVGGGLGDRLGRKGVMQVGLVIFGITSVLGAVATSTGQLILARGAMGIGAALVFPATLAILTNVFTNPVERAKAIGLWSAVSGLPSPSARSPGASCWSTTPGVRCSSSTCRSWSWPWWPAPSCCRARGTPRPAASTPSARSCPSPAWACWCSP